MTGFGLGPMPIPQGLEPLLAGSKERPKTETLGYLEAVNDVVGQGTHSSVEGSEAGPEVR